MPHMQKIPVRLLVSFVGRIYVEPITGVTNIFSLRKSETKERRKC